MNLYLFSKYFYPEIRHKNNLFLNNNFCCGVNLIIKEKLNGIINKVNYTLIRSKKRKSIALIINSDKGLIVRAPEKAPLSKIESFISQKRSWIEKKLTDLKNSSHRDPYQFITNEKIEYIGNSINLNIEYDISETEIKLENNILHVSIQENKKWYKSYAPRILISEWLKLSALKFFKQRALEFSSILNTSPKDIKIRSYKTRWGCCNQNNEIIFNWKLIQLPQSTIDYVILHELVHLIYFNHSKNFWYKIEEVLPNYREEKKFLRNNVNYLKLL